MYCTLGLIEGVYGLYINEFEPQNLAIPTKRDNFLFKADLDVFWSAESISEVHFCPKKFVQPARNLPCLPVHNCSEQLIGLWVNTGDWILGVCWPYYCFITADELTHTKDVSDVESDNLCCHVQSQESCSEVLWSASCQASTQKDTAWRVWWIDICSVHSPRSTTHQNI